MDTETMRATEIARVNDRFRGMCLDVIYTSGVRDGIMDLVGLSAAVESYSRFTEDNDPYGEHDFGSFTLDGEKVFWKIDYYDSELTGWCDPRSEECHRQLTVMLAEEY